MKTDLFQGLTFCMLAMAAKPKHLTTNRSKIYKRNTNYQFNPEPAAIASMLLVVVPWPMF